MTYFLDRSAGKAVRIRHCPATVKRNEPATATASTEVGRRRRRNRHKALSQEPAQRSAE